MTQIETQRWYVVYSKPRKEEYVRFQVQRKGVEIFFPKILLPHSLPKRRKIVPLFPNYLFVRIQVPEEYNYVRWSPGVKNVVNFNGTPVPLDDDIVEFLKQRANSEGVLAARSTLTIGQEVRINSGSFAGLVGIIQNPPDAQGRVKVLLELLGRRVKVDVPVRLTESGWIIANEGREARKRTLE